LLRIPGSLPGHGCYRAGATSMQMIAHILRGLLVGREIRLRITRV
jgi:hypothetical protein